MGAIVVCREKKVEVLSICVARERLVGQVSAKSCLKVKEKPLRGNEYLYEGGGNLALTHDLYVIN